MRSGKNTRSFMKKVVGLRKTAKLSGEAINMGTSHRNFPRVQWTLGASDFIVVGMRRSTPQIYSNRTRPSGPSLRVWRVALCMARLRILRVPLDTSPRRTPVVSSLRFPCQSITTPQTTRPPTIYRLGNAFGLSPRQTRAAPLFCCRGGWHSLNFRKRFWVAHPCGFGLRKGGAAVR